MALAGITLDNGDVLLKFVQTAAETSGEAHIQEARYQPGSRPPPYHRHPHQDERFKVLEGSLRFVLNGIERTVTAGEVLDIPRGTLHLAHNPQAVPAIALWETRPALRTADFFVAMNKAMKGRSRPRLVDAAAILTEFKNEFQLAKPHPLIQNIVFGCLAPFGRIPA
jgi:mannose-6-phosphate isomerase-like protein (cupin superfamily)